MRIMVAGGTGFIGQHLIAQLIKRNIEIAVIGRDTNKIKKLFGNDVYDYVSKILLWRNGGSFIT